MGSPKRVDRICPECQTPFRPTLSHVKVGKGRFCSPACGAVARARGIRQRLLEQHPLPSPLPGSEDRYVSLNHPGRFAIVDASDYEKVASYTWLLFQGNGRAYAFRYLPRATNTKQRTIFLHRELFGLPVGSTVPLVDHRDGDGLNNRRSNIRLCTNTENTRNQRVQNRKKSSRFKGVSFWKFKGVWQERRRRGRRLRQSGNSLLWGILSHQQREVNLWKHGAVYGERGRRSCQRKG